MHRLTRMNTFTPVSVCVYGVASRTILLCIDRLTLSRVRSCPHHFSVAYYEFVLLLVFHRCVFVKSCCCCFLFFFSSSLQNGDIIGECKMDRIIYKSTRFYNTCEIIKYIHIYRVQRVVRVICEGEWLGMKERKGERKREREKTVWGAWAERWNRRVGMSYIMYRLFLLCVTFITIIHKFTFY